MHITLTGNLGSGKTTIAKIVNEKYGYELCKTGAIIREIAKEHGMDVLEMNHLMDVDPQYDHLVDDMTARVSRENPDKKILFDSRLAWHFVEKSFKVFLNVDQMEAARRVLHDEARADAEKYSSVEDAYAKLVKRAETEDKRYEDYYGVHYFDMHNYDLVLDSTFTTPEILSDIIINECDERKQVKIEGESHEEAHTALYISKKRGLEAFSSLIGDALVEEKNINGAEFYYIKIK